MDKVEVTMLSLGMVDRAPGKDLLNPVMTTYPNPLATETADEMQRMRIVDRNMHRLTCDAKKRACPVHGNVYAGIMNTRMKEGA